jgi:hypothetical protein
VIKITRKATKKTHIVGTIPKSNAKAKTIPYPNCDKKV